MGEHDTSDSIADLRDVSKIRNHPRYDFDTTDYDFSILFLTFPLTFSYTIAPICLPASTQSLYTGQMATVTGWGDTSSDGSPASTLQEVQMTVMSNEECDTYYPGKIERYQDNFHQYIQKNISTYLVSTFVRVTATRIHAKEILEAQ